MIRSGSAPELEAFREARAEAWCFALACLAENRREDCRANKNAAGVTSTNGDDAKKGSSKHEVRATQNCT